MCARPGDHRAVLSPKMQRVGPACASGELATLVDRLTPLNLRTRVLPGRLLRMIRRGGRPADLPEELALGDPSQTAAEPLQARRADMDQVVELEVDRGDHRRVGDLVGDYPLGVADDVPTLRVDARNEPADLDVIERQVGLTQIGADRGNELSELLGKLGGGGLHRVALP